MSLSFDLTTIKANTDGWGPTGSLEKFNDIPYAPFSKSEKIGKCSDWNSNMKQYHRQNIYGANASNPFTFKLEEDEESFQLVDYSRPTVNKSRFHNKGPRQFNQRGGYGGGQRQQGGRVILDRYSSRGGKRGGRPFNRFWNDRRQKNRESSIEIQPTWENKQEIDLTPLKTLYLETAPQPELIATCGAAKYYNINVERVTARDDKNLIKNDKAVPLIPTSDDKFFRKNYQLGSIYITDSILATLMTANRSVYSWDIVVIRVGGKTFFEHRPGTTDNITVYENANLHYDDKDPINSPAALSNEASVINQNYQQQALSQDTPAYKFETELEEDEYDSQNCVTVGYRYMKYDLGDDLVVLARTEVDGAVLEKGQTKFIAIKATNEFDPRRDQSTDFRKNIDNQRASILANEMKNNSTKFAKWSIQATLGGIDMMSLGYVSRTNPLEPTAHKLLASQLVTVSSLNNQNRVDMRNTWAIAKSLIETCAKLPQGKYLLHRDPNRPVVNIYSVPDDAFDPEDEDAIEDEDNENDSQNKGWVQSTN
ncbi:hypothetical protein SAMD00019534_024960 [Acytostelium subglobosum LB1]|uniref:hypothetical protein n=1 Tax=Acytostelium subglobosum LB1 TaxID=1410327 RepID=UPI0006447CFD|nr:hypothetical protein SAMD00019534_024960 [Acytostelium subglobosum LB1]GAM19321.1 hypothetical protein SAMD00019534_024960 [Acytostelium subglobosum LB1]|eukprot:XP_012757248.1 hypothetical protein SAMD00019534_024960 [Acytostelium subglobosum LB1]